jgi:hypothetical protein
MRWSLEDENFHEQYARAQEIRAEYMAEEIIDIADKSLGDIVGDDKSDNARVSARKLQVDARKWTAVRMNPKKWAETKKHEVTGKDGGPVAVKGNAITFVKYNERDTSKSEGE